MTKPEGSVREIEVLLPHTALPDADWVDCWQALPVANHANARQAGEAIIAAFPRWMGPLLALRQILVAPFGLLGKDDMARETDAIGFFPVTEEGATRLVAGLDDKHLNFRIVIDLDATTSGRSLALTTVIKRHNLLGRLYLAMVLPFHRAIIRGALKKLVVK